MQSINALSFTPDVNGWLMNSRHPRVLHVFDHACNLINERREVLSIVTQEIGDGPFNLVIDDDVLFSNHLNLESPISSSPNLLNLGDLIIHTDSTRLWFPRPDWETLYASRDDVLNQLMSLRACEIERSNPLHDAEIASSQRTSALLAMTSTQLLITNYQLLNSPISNSLASALANADLPASINAAQKLAGLGIGLTPSGDDFIMGAIFAAWIIHPTDVVGAFAAEVTEVAAALTTSLSGAWLRSAGRGEAGILWHNFFDALISADAIAIQLSVKKILSIGHTSGADALAGFFGVFTAWAGVFRKNLVGV
jgi:uncharacterized protein DUF2877